MTAGQDAHAGTRTAIAALDAKFLAVENELLHPSNCRERPEVVPRAMGLYLKFLWLQAEVGTGGGDVDGQLRLRADARATRGVQKLAGDLAAQKAKLKVVYRDDVPAFEKVLNDAGLSRIIRVPATKPPTADAR